MWITRLDVRDFLETLHCLKNNYQHGAVNPLGRNLLDRKWELPETWCSLFGQDIGEDEGGIFTVQEHFWIADVSRAIDEKDTTGCHPWQDQPYVFSDLFSLLCGQGMGADERGSFTLMGQFSTVDVSFTIEYKNKSLGFQKRQATSFPQKKTSFLVLRMQPGACMSKM